VIGDIFLALFNGSLVSTARSVNGKLGGETDAFRASFWNHFVGFLVLTVILAVVGGWDVDFGAPPPHAYLGGMIGAGYVAINSYVFVRLGAMYGALLVISGQMFAAVVIDYIRQGVPPSVTRWAGVALVIFGVYLSRASEAAHERKTSTT
jgi:transporter family-2 protein